MFTCRQPGTIVRVLFAAAAVWASLAVDADSIAQGTDQTDAPTGEAHVIQPNEKRPVITEDAARQMLRADPSLIALYMSLNQLLLVARDVPFSEAQITFATEQHRQYDQRIERQRDRLADALLAPWMLVVNVHNTGVDPAPEEMIEVLSALSDALAPTRNTVSGELDRLLHAIRSVLDDTQTECFDAGLRAWRRRVMLNAGVSGGRGEDLMYHVDLIALIENFARDHGDLLGDAQDSLLAATVDCYPSTDPIAHVLNDYSRALDTILGNVFWGRWEDHYRGMLASLTADDRSLEPFRRRRFDRWYRVYRCNGSFAKLLAAELPGDEPPRAWMDRYYAAYFPRTHRRNSTDDLVHWLTEEADTGEEQGSTVQLIYTDFTARRETLRRQLRSATVESMRRDGATPSSLISLRVSGELSKAVQSPTADLDTLVQFTNDSLRRILTPEWQIEFDARLAALESRGVDGPGPAD